MPVTVNVDSEIHKDVHRVRKKKMPQKERTVALACVWFRLQKPADLQELDLLLLRKKIM